MEDIIIAFSFGKDADISSNHAISLISEALSVFLPARIIADKSIPFDGKENFTYIGPIAEVHESTLNLARQIAEMAKVEGKNWKRLIVVSAPDYMWRARRDLKKVLRREGIKVRVVDWRDVWKEKKLPQNIPKSVQWYDKKSKQLWTRYQWLFRKREAILRRTPFWIYEKITG